MNPTSYNVIKDTSGLKPDHLQVTCISFSPRFSNLLSAEVGVQVYSSLLQLARDCEGPSSLPVRTQVGFLGGGELAQGAQRAAGAGPLLPVKL